MISATLVDTLGLIAGAVWLSGAFYFQQIREDEVHPFWVLLMFSMGTALWMSSAAITLSGRPEDVAILGLLGNGIFLLVGIGTWIALEKYAEFRETVSTAAVFARFH